MDAEHFVKDLGRIRMVRFLVGTGYRRGGGKMRVYTMNQCCCAE